MAIRLPLKTVLDVNNTAINATGPASTSGGVANAFDLPQDTANVVVKLTASVMDGGVSALLQTTDDGGTTWYDLAETSIVSNATNAAAEWLSVPVAGLGVSTTANAVASAGTWTFPGSVLSATGSASANTIGQKTVSGLPILSQRGRVFLKYTAAVTSIINERVKVLVNDQSATA